MFRAPSPGLTALPYRAADDADFFPLPAGYRQDPRWIAAQADYIREDDGEADTAITMRRIEAAYRMYDIQREYADGAP